MSLKIENLHVSIDNKEILKGVHLEIQPGDIHVIMGPNGSGKSTLANTLMGHPKYDITDGIIDVDGENITHADVHKRAHAGLFLSMQYPPEVSGVTISTFLRQALEAKTGKKQHPIKFYGWLQEQMKALHIDPDFAKRYVHAGFSGGEKKKAEILQLCILNPTYAILDETDSGLDVDALKIVSDGINTFHNKQNGILLITHYTRILNYVKPDFVHILRDGNIIESGDAALAERIEREGYTHL